MCTNGVNNAQLLQMIQQLDDHIALERRWMHKLAHIAEDGGYENAHEKMHEAQALLDNVRALLDEAKASIEDGEQVSPAQTTVKLV
ncbi:MAG: dynein gamma chain protein [Clostridia bacterium]|nr:dynein gamma chain protein [Clostridia bacterium]